MIHINLQINDEETTKVVGFMSGLYLLAEHFDSRLYRYQLTKNIETRHWSVDLFIDFINRDKKEIDLVFGENREIKFLTELFKAPIKLNEDFKLKFSKYLVAPEKELDLSIDDSLKNLILSATINVESNENDFPYLPVSKQETLKPWDTWLSWLQRLSIETQRSVFLSMVSDIIADDCIEMMKWDTTIDQINYFIHNATREENREFVEYFIKRTSEVDQAQLISTIDANSKRVIALNQIVKKE